MIGTNKPPSNNGGGPFPKPWMYSKASHTEWGRFLGSRNDVLQHGFDSLDGGMSGVRIEEQRDIVEFENHLIVFSKFIHRVRLLAVYDTRTNTLLLNQFYIDRDEFPVQFEWLRNYISEVNIQTCTEIYSIPSAPVGTAIIENRCPKNCAYHPRFPLTVGGAL